MNINTNENQELIKFTDIEALVSLRNAAIAKSQAILALENEIKDIFKPIDRYSVLEIHEKHMNYVYGKTLTQKIDYEFWSATVSYYDMKKYMLCSEYDKMIKQLYEFNFPEFTYDNVMTWREGLKALVYDNIQRMIEEVFAQITDGTYRTGGSYSTSQKKKRNNNGIDKHFILSAYDNSSYNSRPTITDDLEKCCYIVNGETLPQKTLKQTALAPWDAKSGEAENNYLKIKICANGNTHYWIEEKTRNILNLYGSRKGIIGENIKIKVFGK